MQVLLALKGLPGSGKSALAQALTRQLRWPLIAKDDIKDILLDYGTPADGAAYALMLGLARRQLVQGLSVICDSPLLRTTYDNVQRLAADTGARLVVIECRCSDEVLWRRRVEARQVDARGADRIIDWDALLAYRSRHPDTDYVIREAHLIVETSSSHSDTAKRCLDWLLQAGVRLP
jgi:predicted kinase